MARVYTSYETEGHFLAFYTVLNCYIYLLAYVYSPSSTQVSDGSDVVSENLEIIKKGSEIFGNFGPDRLLCQLPKFSE